MAVISNTFSADAKNTLSTGDIPWAVVLLPTTSAGHSDGGDSKHGLLPTSWVFGFFADGDNCQQPIVVGVVPGGPGQGSGAPSSSSGAPSMAGGSGNQPVGPGANPSGSHVKIAMDFFVNKHDLTIHQAAGIVGSMQGESHANLDTNAVGSGGDFGICQWTGPRKAALKAYAGNNLYDFQTQLNFLWKELEEGSDGGHTLSYIKLCHSYEEACHAWTKHFERPKVDNSSQRIPNARRVWQQYQNGVPSN